jgi:hypothetical protein
MTSDDFQAAKDELRAAIAAFYEATAPDVYVSAWVLVTHKESIELEQAGQSAVGVLVATGQPFPLTRGLLEVALDGERTTHQLEHPGTSEDGAE